MCIVGGYSFYKGYRKGLLTVKSSKVIFISEQMIVSNIIIIYQQYMGKSN